MNIGTRSLRPRKLLVPAAFSEAALSGIIQAEGKNPAGLLQSLLEQMTKQRCTPHTAELLLTTMSTHFSDLEANHQELMSVIMARIYLEVVTTDDPLVRLNLLQLVETRARLWRNDSATDKFYANRKLTINEQISPQVFKKPDYSSKQVSEDVHVEQLKSKSVRDQMHEQRLVVSDKVEIRLFSNCNTTLQESYSILQNYYREKNLRGASSVELKQEHSSANSVEDQRVESGRESNNVKISKHLTDESYTIPKQARCFDPSVSDNQSAASSNRKPLMTVDSVQISLAKSTTAIASAARKVEHQMTEKGIQDLSTKLCCKSDELQERFTGEVKVINDKKPVLNYDIQADGLSDGDADEVNRYATPDLPSEGSSFLTVSDGEDDLAESCSSTSPAIESQLQHVAKETGAGDCMIALDTKSASGWAGGWQKIIDCSASDATVLSDDGDGCGEEASNLCSERTADSQLIQYQRDFLLRCGNKVSAENLPHTWPELCATFKGVCLSTKEAQQLQLSDSFPSRYSIVRMNSQPNGLI